MKRALFTVAVVVSLAVSALAGPPDNYISAARDAGRWISASAIQQQDGVVWPADPRDPKSVMTTLYSGTPGPILFFLEAYRYTGNKEYLRQARAGADALLASMPRDQEAGLYEGRAGSGFTLGQAYLVTHDARYRDAALQAVAWLKQSAKPQKDGGVAWNDTTDVIAGSAGTGLFLLWADEHLHAPGARELAAKAGDHLLAIAEHPAAGQDKWMMDPTFPREMPNFSHGTAGVGYFLATLYQKTGDKRYLDGAVAAGKYLASIAEKVGQACLIYHDDKQGRQMYYLGWCHGPAGTSRFFYRLYQVTRDPQWMDWMTKLARSLTETDLFARAVTPGEWDNVSVCCGLTAEAEFYLNLYQVTRDKQYLDFAQKATDLLLAKATRDAAGARWVQAENRISPNEKIAQTGLMQGASGIGLWLLHYSAYRAGKHRPTITLPDNPFSY